MTRTRPDDTTVRRSSVSLLREMRLRGRGEHFRVADKSAAPGGVGRHHQFRREIVTVPDNRREDGRGSPGLSGRDLEIRDEPTSKKRASLWRRVFWRCRAFYFDFSRRNIVRAARAFCPTTESPVRLGTSRRYSIHRESCVSSLKFSVLLEVNHWKTLAQKVSFWLRS